MFGPTSDHRHSGRISAACRSSRVRLSGMTFLMPYDLLTPNQRRELEDQADAERHRAIEGTLYWLTHAGVPARARRRVAALGMVASVFAQAALLGVVGCSRCGDRGCDWCKPVTFA